MINDGVISSKKFESYGLALIDYNSGKRTSKFLSDFIRVTDVYPAIIVIVDNYITNDESYNILKKDISCYREIIPDSEDELFDKASKYVVGQYCSIKVILVKSKLNYGYARANNLAAMLIKKAGCKTILFSNSDIIFDEEVFYTSAFLKKIADDNKILGLGSEVVSLDRKTIQSPCRYLSIQDRHWRGYLFWPFLKTLYKPKNEIVDNLEHEQKVYRLIGAFFFVNVNNFFNAGLFDDNTFLYAEELIIAERAKQKGYYMYYIPGYRVIHEEGATTKEKKSKFDCRRLKRMVKSDIYYYKKYKHVSKMSILVTNIITNCYIFKRSLVSKIIKR